MSEGTDNALLLTQLALGLATQLQQLLSTQAQARAEGRDITDDEVRAAGLQTQKELDALQMDIDAKRKG